MIPTNRDGFITDDRRFEKLYSKGLSKEKAIRVATASGHHASKHDSQHPRYEKWSTDDLYQKAVELGVEGCSAMSKHTLINVLKSY